MEEINRNQIAVSGHAVGLVKEHMDNQTELATEMGVPNVHVCKFFSGGGGVTFRTERKFAHALKVDFILGICKRLRKGKR